MKFTTSAAAIGAASLAAAQNVTLPPIGMNATSSSASSIPVALGEALLSMLSPQCQQTVEYLLAPNSSLGSCIHTDYILNIINANSSIVPPLDGYLSTICSGQPCDPSVLANVSQTLTSGCASDLSAAGISNSTVELVFDNYPLAREIACLKTVQPFNGTNASIPVTAPAYNHTNGTFCVTSILTEVSAYVGANLTNSFIDTVALGGNSTALNLLESIPPTALCNDCIYAALDLVYEEYPQLGNYSLVGNSTNYTLSAYLNGTCAASNYTLSYNGTLPSTIDEVAYNSTFAYNVTGANFTFVPPPYATKVPALNASLLNSTMAPNVTEGTGPVAANLTSPNARAMKGRWVGQ